jgi:hypothetical protein
MLELKADVVQTTLMHLACLYVSFNCPSTFVRRLSPVDFRPYAELMAGFSQLMLYPSQNTLASECANVIKYFGDKRKVT